MFGSENVLCGLDWENQDHDKVGLCIMFLFFTLNRWLPENMQLMFNHHLFFALQNQIQDVYKRVSGGIRLFENIFVSFHSVRFYGFTGR